jgi:two-component system chemotaxis response regulator CheY
VFFFGKILPEDKGGSMRALVVDDSAVMRKVLIGALSRAGITKVDQAADGVEAVEAATGMDYNVILMDWNMPNMLGIDALKTIRANGKSTPVIMVTTEAEKRRVVEAIQAGAQNYVVKPFTPEGIVEKILTTIDS